MAKPKNPTAELGVASSHVNQGFRWDEFIPELRGQRAMRKYREMRDNDPIIGAILTAMDMLLRAVDWRVEAVDDTPQATEAAEFVESVFADMEHTQEEFLSEALSFLPYGFSFFEVVYKKREGMAQKDKSRQSQFDDGYIGIRKLASRAQWTIEEFITDQHGEILGIKQEPVYTAGFVTIPIEKGVLFRTASLNNEPSGRSVLRNAYLPYHYASHITTVESIAIERELNGLPVARIPAEYLAATATDNQIAFRNKITKLVRDVKLNEQGYVVLPSDLIENDDGSKTSTPMVGFELMASSGSRDIDTTKVVIRHQQDMARSVMADFLMLGQAERGSFALSKSKSDLFLRSLEGYANNIAATINNQLMPTLWELNGFDFDLMPKMVPGNVAPVDLEELGSFIQRLSQSGAPLFPDTELENVVRGLADLPETADDADPDLMGRPTDIEDDEAEAEDV